MKEHPAKRPRLNLYILITAYLLLVVCLIGLLVATIRDHDFRPWLLLAIVFGVIAWTNRAKWVSRFPRP